MIGIKRGINTQFFFFFSNDFHYIVLKILILAKIHILVEKHMVPLCRQRAHTNTNTKVE